MAYQSIGPQWMEVGTNKLSLAKNHNPSSAIMALGQQWSIRDPDLIPTYLHDNQCLRSNPASVPKPNQRPRGKI
jgi:hypothetical protein